MFNLKDLLEEMANHAQTIDLANCPHCCTNGDNYGDSCAHCGKQLKGFGYGGWFGSNLRSRENCIHDFASLPAADGEPALELCRFCERVQEIEEISQSVN